MNKTITTDEFLEVDFMSISEDDKMSLEEIYYDCPNCSRETELHLFVSDDKRLWVANCGCCGSFNITTKAEVAKMHGFRNTHANIIKRM